METSADRNVRGTRVATRVGGGRGRPRRSRGVTVRGRTRPPHSLRAGRRRGGVEERERQPSRGRATVGCSLARAGERRSGEERAGRSSRAPRRTHPANHVEMVSNIARRSRDVKASRRGARGVAEAREGSAPGRERRRRERARRCAYNVAPDVRESRIVEHVKVKISSRSPASRRIARPIRIREIEASTRLRPRPSRPRRLHRAPRAVRPPRRPRDHRHRQGAAALSLERLVAFRLPPSALIRRRLAPPSALVFA